MGPKKKGGKKDKVEEKEEESEYATMDLEMLREVVPMLRQQLDKSMLDRNYVQLERVSASSFPLSTSFATSHIAQFARHHATTITQPAITTMQY
jgi:hypothetical protein